MATGAACRRGLGSSGRRHRARPAHRLEGPRLGRHDHRKHPDVVLVGGRQPGTCSGAEPRRSQARLAFARFLLDDGNLVDAVRQFDAASRLDPTNAEALAYGGWIIALAGVTDGALERLDAAVVADPDYPDAHLFRGMTLLDTGRPAEALPELERYLELAPDTPQRTQIEALIDQARERATPDAP